MQRSHSISYNWEASLGACPLCGYRWPKRVSVSWIVTLTQGEKLETVLKCPICSRGGHLAGLVIHLAVEECHTFADDLDIPTNEEGALQ